MSDGQLDLLTGRKARKPPSALEFEIHCMVADTLRVSCSPGWLWWHTPNGGWRSKAEAGKFKRMGVKPGVPDFLLLSPDGRLHALEIKRRGEKPSDEQMQFMGHIGLTGGQAVWADNFDGAISVLKAWGAVRVRL